MGGYNQTGIGAQFMESMLLEYPKDRIHRFSPIVGPTKLADDHFGYKTTTFPIGNSPYPIASSYYYWQFSKKSLSNQCERIRLFIKEKKIELVWVILNHFSVMQLAAVLSTKVNVPLISHVWDTPEYLIKQRFFDPFTRKHILSSFDRVLRNSTRVVTVSDSMGEIYKKKYSVDYTTMVFCPPKEAWQAFEKKPPTKEIKVIFAGTLYAYREWHAFLDAVEYFNKNSNNRKIKVTCLGNVSRWSKKRSWVNYEATKPISEAARLVNQSDIAYLPYWMDSSKSYFVKTAFPGKMSFYVAAGTPVLFHGPKASTPAYFLNENKVGMSCHSLNQKDILDTLETVLQDDFQSQYKTTQQKVLEKKFHPKRLVEQFQNVIDASLANDFLETK